MTALLETRALSKNFGALRGHPRRQLHARGRRAPRADRPERRRQDHLHQPAHRRAGAERRRRVCSRAATSRRSSRPSGSSAASRARSRSTGCSAASRCWRMSISRSPSASARRRPCSSRPASARDVIDEAMDAARTAEARRRRRTGPFRNCPMAASAWSSSRSRSGLKPEGAAARRAGRRRAERGKPHHPRRHRRAAEEHRRADHRPRHGPGVPLRQAHHRAGARRGVRRRHAEGDRRQPRRARGLSRTGRPMARRAGQCDRAQRRVGRLRRDRGAGGHQPRARAAAKASA